MTEQSSFSRRAFFTTAAVAIGATAIGIAGSSSASAASVSDGVSSLKDGRVRVDPSKIAGLQFVGGSVNVGKVDGKLVGLIRTKASKYRAVSLRCTHGNSIVSWQDNVWVCREHGCTYSASGKVRQGPAKKKLKSVKVKTSGKYLVVGAKPKTIA
jgi:Rieske Fe-S protein